MKLHIENIDENTWLINGVKFTKPEPFKTKWPTSTQDVVFLLEYNKGNVPVNDLDHDKANKITACLDAARAINGDWEPDWNDEEQVKYFPKMYPDQTVNIGYATNKACRINSFVWFPTNEACQHFIDHFSDIWLEAIR